MLRFKRLSFLLFSSHFLTRKKYWNFMRTICFYELNVVCSNAWSVWKLMLINYAGISTNGKNELQISIATNMVWIKIWKIRYIDDYRSTLFLIHSSSMSEFPFEISLWEKPCFKLGIISRVTVYINLHI